MTSEFSLYFHIPFCTRKCDYCHFYVLPDKDSYKVLLMKGFELEWKLKSPIFYGKKLVSIYFGGGTPSLLGAPLISQILAWIEESPVEISEQIEITLEANPENISYELMQAYAEAGINRVSIGIQSLDDSLLQKLNRTHSSAKAIYAVEETYRAGIHNITIDLMYDLPGQTLTLWKETLHQACKLPISHLSLYNLTIEPHTVFFKQRKQIEAQIPNDETSLQMYQEAIKTFKSQGFEHYEISAFAKGNRISKHNIGYWTARPFYGFGPSAFSDWEGTRFRNIANLNRYVDLLQNGLSPIDFEEKLDFEARLRELFVIHLRLLKGIDLDLFQARHGALNSTMIETLNNLSAEGLLTFTAKHVSLTQKGILFHDSVAADLI